MLTCIILPSQQHIYDIFSVKTEAKSYKEQWRARGNHGDDRKDMVFFKSRGYNLTFRDYARYKARGEVLDGRSASVHLLVQRSCVEKMLRGKKKVGVGTPTFLARPYLSRLRALQGSR